jgi:pimeloyl-ACP methyl ester carboxylesterase
MPMTVLRIDDIDLHFECEGDGPPLLLIHGVGARLDNWDGVAERLKGRFSLIRPDLRGHGRSSKTRPHYSLDLFSSDLIALLDHLRVERCGVVGHSLGGMIAQRLSLRNPQRVSALALLSTAFGRTSEEKAKVLARVALIQDGIAGDHFHNSLARWFTDEFRAQYPDFIARYAERNAENDPACYAEAYRVLATSDLGDEIAAIACPTLIVTGEHDQGSSPEMARRMHALITGSELHILPRMRHSILIEAPDQVAELVGTFFSKRENE